MYLVKLKGFRGYYLSTCKLPCINVSELDFGKRAKKKIVFSVLHKRITANQLTRRDVISFSELRNAFKTFLLHGGSTYARA